MRINFKAVSIVDEFICWSKLLVTDSSVLELDVSEIAVLELELDDELELLEEVSEASVELDELSELLELRSSAA